jgi:excisionase family DNA binding protein
LTDSPQAANHKKDKGMSIRTYNQPMAPSKATVDFAKKAIHELARPGARLALVDRATGHELPLGDQVFDLIRQMLASLAHNRAISIVPLDHELTPNQAADLLNVSRGYVNGLVDDNKLPARMVGTHRRIRLDDLLDYKRRLDAETDQALDDLVAAEQELDLD